ncbi:MAG: tetratricopeptide repeat protein [Chloroflexota bacterium]
MTEASSAGRLTVRLFGTPRFQIQEGQDLTIRMTKSKGILAYLASTGEEKLRSTLAGLLWSDMLETSARANLRAAITSLRKEVGDYLLATRQRIGLDPTMDIWVDSREIERLWQLWQRREAEVDPSDIRIPLRSVLAQADNEFLDGLSIPDAPLFEEWILLERERYNQIVIDALTAMTVYAIENHLIDEGIEDAIQILRLDPWRESAHRHLIHLYALQGQRVAALNQFEKCRELLQAEFNVHPEASTLALVERIRQGTIVPISEEISDGQEISSSKEAGTQPVDLASDPVQLMPPPTNLPTPTTLFFGRAETLIEIQRLLVEETSCQVLTLVGPGGIGKTRLALEVAPILVEEFPHGTYFVSFTTVSRLDQIVLAIAEVLNFSFYGDVDPQVQLIQYLNDRQMLFVLDNFEHLVTGADILSHILQGAPALRMLITSQERLNLHEEWVLSVDGLTCPSFNQIAHWPEHKVAQLLDPKSKPPFLGYSALELFVQRAKLVRGDFALSEEELSAVVRICEMVDGAPLGIELSAVWVKMLSCREIADEIEQNLDFLTTSLRNLPQRHRSLRAVFNHAWSLLLSEEQAVFRRLAIFAGPFSRQSAQAVADASALDLIALVDKSLVHSRDSGQFMLHGQLKQYAAEHLSQNSNELAELRQRHGIYFANYLQERNQELKGSVQKESQEKVLTEVVDVIEEARAAWRWAVQHKELEQIGKLLDTLFRVYEMRSWFQEGVENFGNAIEQISEHIESEHTDHSGQSPSTQAYSSSNQVEWRHLLGQLLARQGWFQFQLGRSDLGRTQLEQALSNLHDTADQSELIFVLNYLGAVYRDAGEYDLAEERLQRSLQLCQDINELFGHTVALNILGNVYYLQGNYDEAQRLCRESLDIKRAIGDRWGVRFSLSYLGVIAGLQGNHQEAEQLFRESLAIAEAIDDRRGMGNCLTNLGNTVAARGAYEDAKRFHQRGLHIYAQIGNELGVIKSHTQLGELAIQETDFSRSWIHLETALVKAQSIGSLPAIGEVLFSIALHHMESAYYQEALDILEIVQTHPAITQGIRDKALTLTEKLSQISSSMPAAPPDVANQAKMLLSATPPVKEATDESVAALVTKILENVQSPGRIPENEKASVILS